MTFVQIFNDVFIKCDSGRLYLISYKRTLIYATAFEKKRLSLYGNLICLLLSYNYNKRLLKLAICVLTTWGGNNIYT